MTLEHEHTPTGPRPSCYLYSREALVEALAGIVDLDRFLMRLGPRKVFKSAYWGGDLIRAIEQAVELGDDGAESRRGGFPGVGVIDIGGPAQAGKNRGDQYPPGVAPIDPKAIK